MDQIHLTVMADDFGMHAVVNEGILETFVDGLLTDANIMAVCPGFEESVRMAKQHNLPVGLHSTFSCDFDRFRWRPLTDMKTMIDKSRHFLSTVASAWENADLDEASKEQKAQLRMLLDNGITVTHLSEHMGTDDSGKLFRIQSELADETGIPHRFVSNPIFRNTPILQHNFDNHIRSSSIGADYKTRKAFLKEKLFALKKPGYYNWIVHPAADHPVLDEFQTPNTPLFVWGRLYRVLDYRLLLDPEVKSWVDELNIRLTPVSEVPFSKTVRKF